MGIKTYNDIYLAVRRQLRGAGVAAFDLEARLIVTTASGKTREEFLRDRQLYVTDKAYKNTVDDMLRRRMRGEPMAYILGEWEFYGLTLAVGPGVLIPRTDTEVLAAAAIGLYRDAPGPARILDLCAGSGCVGLAIAARVPACRVLLADNSEEALRLCRANAARNSLSRSVMSMQIDALGDPPILIGRFHAIVCNPPYIPTGDIPGLDASVRDFEPVSALDGGPDGLRFFRSVAAKWKAVLKDGGRMAFECGAGQAADVRAILAENGFEDITSHRDTLDIERVVIGTVSGQGGQQRG